MTDKTTEPADLDRLVKAGWIVLKGNTYVMTDAGRLALRNGFPARLFGPTMPIDSARARAKPSIKKKGKRHG